MRRRAAGGLETHDHAETPTSDVLEAQVESAEAVADDEEQAVRADRVLVLGEERRVEAEREGDLGRAARRDASVSIALPKESE